MEKCSDKEIVQSVLAGEKEAYGVLLEKYQNLVFSVALRYFCDADTAEDVLQETFLLGYQNLERLREPALFGSWIAGIAKNICRNFLRDRKKTAVSLEEYMAETGIEPGDSGDFSDYDEETTALLRKAIIDLPEKYREIIHLRYTENFSCNKIADFLNLSRSAVLSRLLYARKAILKIIKKEGKI